jgi:four helix bundle protein
MSAGVESVPIRSHRDLRVWQKSMQLVEGIYRLSLSFPHAESYGLTAQLRRAAISVPANIAEGRGRDSRRDFAKFVSIARGSLMEADTLLEIAMSLSYAERGSVAELQSLVTEIASMLSRLRTSLLK